MKRNNTKKALVLSAISILVCLTMLIGSTFAWFTDTASTAVSTIQSGILDVGLEHKVNNEWKDAEGKTLNFVRHECTNGRMLWEPGCTYDLEPIKVKNNGNLALKYKIELTGIDGDAKLLEVIDWTVKMGETEIDLATYEGVLYPADATNIPEGGSSESGEITISGHMKEEAGNEYQNLTLEGIGICVYATQYAWECDSYGHTYDENAGATECTVTDIYELRRALESPYNENIVIENDLFNNPNEDIYHPVVTTGDDADKATTFATIPEGVTKVIDFNGHTLKFKTNNIKNDYNYSIIDNRGVLVLGNSEQTGGIELTHEGENMSWNALSSILYVNDGEVHIYDDVTLEHKGGTDMAYAIDIMSNGSTRDPVVNIYGGTIKSTYRAIRQFVNGGPNTLNISGGEIIGGTAAVWMMHHYGVGNLNISGGTLKTTVTDARTVYIDGAHETVGDAAQIHVSITGGQIISETAETDTSHAALVVNQGLNGVYAGHISLNEDFKDHLVNEANGTKYVLIKCGFNESYNNETMLIERYPEPSAEP